MTVSEIIRDRYTSLLYGCGDDLTQCQKPEIIEGAEALFDSLAEDKESGLYRWDDINYSDDRRAQWEPIEHTSRIVRIITSLGREKLRTDAEYRNKLLSALDFWLTNDFTNPNWWHNEIGTPRLVSNICFLLYDYLGEERLARAAEIIGRGSMTCRPVIAKWTGANVLWGSANTIRYGALTNNEEAIKIAAERAVQEISVGGIEGIQSDGSFFQHGPRLYSGGYGRSYIADIAMLAYLLSGTEYEIPSDKIELFFTHLLDGVRYMTVDGVLDPISVGRELVRRNATLAGGILDSVNLLLKIDDIPRRADLVEYKKELEGKFSKLGDKYFNKALMLCYRHHGIYIGAKYLNDELAGEEECNGEGVLCDNMAYGTNYSVMRTGREYFNVAPVYDYSRIPGTTSYHETDAELSARKNWHGFKMSSHSGGGVEGDISYIFEYAEHDGIEIYSSCFGTKDGFVCLGCFRADGHGHDLATTVDQCRADTADGIKFKGHCAVNNGIKYTALDGSRFRLKVGPAYGTWQRNDVTSHETGIVEEEMFTLTIPHIGNSGRYAYVISAESIKPDVTVVRNDSTAQAIELADGRTVILFHKDAEIEIDGCSVHGREKQLVII